MALRCHIVTNLSTRNSRRNNDSQTQKIVIHYQHAGKFETQRIHCRLHRVIWKTRTTWTRTTRTRARKKYDKKQSKRKMRKKSYQQFYKVTILCEIIVRVRVRVRVTVRVRVSMLSGFVLSVFSR